jgi:hypothetical protein
VSPPAVPTGEVAAFGSAAKRFQTRPNKSKQKRLDIFGFIRQDRDFSMGCERKK